MKRNLLNVLKIGTCLMVAVTCATMLITGNVDEEVVEFVWSHKVFGLLLYVAFVVGRCEFRRDGCVYNVEQGL